MIEGISRTVLAQMEDLRWLLEGSPPRKGYSYRRWKAFQKESLKWELGFGTKTITGIWPRQVLSTGSNRSRSSEIMEIIIINELLGY